jgi:hypothetical protein
MLPATDPHAQAARTAALLGALAAVGGGPGERLAFFWEAAREAGFEPVQVGGGFLVSAGRRRPRVLLDACVEPRGLTPAQTAVLAHQGGLMAALGLAALPALRDLDRAAVLLVGDHSSTPCEPAGPCTIPKLILGPQGGQGFQVGRGRIYTLGVGCKGQVLLRVPSASLTCVQRACQTLTRFGLVQEHPPLEAALTALLPLPARARLTLGRLRLPLPAAWSAAGDPLLRLLLDGGSNTVVAQPEGLDLEAPGQPLLIHLLPGLTPQRYLRELEDRCGPLETLATARGVLSAEEAPLLGPVARLLSVEDPGSVTQPFCNPVFLPRVAAAQAAGIPWAGFLPLPAYAPANDWPYASRWPGDRLPVEGLPFAIRVLQRLLVEVV